MMQFILQKKSLIFSIVFLIFSICIFVFLFSYINNTKIGDLMAQTNWQTEANRQNNIISLAHSVEVIAPERALLETHFVQSSDVAPFLDNIEKLSKEVNIVSEVTSVEISNDNSSLIVEMKASGSFENTYKFITLLENSPYDLDFVLVNIGNIQTENSSTDKNNKTSQWVTNFQIKLLSFVNQ